MAISYEDLFVDGKPNLLPIQDTDEYLDAMLRLVVFKPYLKQEGQLWWKQQLEVLESQSLTQAQQTSQAVIESVILYQDLQSGNKPKEEFKQVVEKLTAALEAAKQNGWETPILNIVAQDYLGLAHRVTSFESGIDTDEKNGRLEKSIEALKQCCTLAQGHDDTHLKLWLGFAKFNSPQVNPQLCWGTSNV